MASNCHKVIHLPEKIHEFIYGHTSMLRSTFHKIILCLPYYKHNLARMKNSFHVTGLVSLRSSEFRRAQNFFISLDMCGDL